MKWQKARQVHSQSESEVDGREFWVEAGAPSLPLLGAHATVKGDLDYWQRPVYRTNIVHPNIGRLAVTSAIVELLPEFAEDVAMVPWEDFCK